MAGYHTSTEREPAGDGTPETAAATSMLNTVIAERYFEQVMRWLEAARSSRTSGGRRPRSATGSCTSPRGARGAQPPGARDTRTRTSIARSIPNCGRRDPAPGHLAAPGLPERIAGREALKWSPRCCAKACSGGTGTHRRSRCRRQDLRHRATARRRDPLHAGAAQMGYLTALEWLPSLLFGLPAGPGWTGEGGGGRR